MPGGVGGRAAHLLALLASVRCANICYDDRPREHGLYDGEIFVDGERRTYVLFIPPTYNGHSPMPLIINW
jgi:poly(3-hydroxybutyrate) depolymerase